ncbi:riboflavin synthase subunit alpha [Bacillus sp. J14TS2]|uniref:riboflavin synthase n=1 Tax=Bacillus sp. J14TS2 TaxID=2807188 RepID=UPI001B2C3CE6|nr:riboflavin synthase [Bacillus sp. J14TS2]GIN73054.1 riboflavin synthase subunit alpha [Bacillus sp. J14TS2]
MFTGIIEEIGIIAQIQAQPQSLKLEITAHTILQDMELGHSIAVNGVCLTVTHFSSEHFSVDVMPETFHTTSLQRLKTGSVVNLERALSLQDRLGGHFVTGHVDGIAVVHSKSQVENALYMTLSVPDEWRMYLLPKGSIALDGTSLTIFKVEDNQVTISLIPHTQEKTGLVNKKIGDVVNLECDVLGKYVEQMVFQTKRKQQSLTKDFLQHNGFF